MAGGEEPKVVRVVGHDDPAPETDGGSGDERVDGHLAARTCFGQEVTGNPSDPSASGYDLSEPPGEHRVDGLVSTTAAVDLHEYYRGNPDGEVAVMGAAHRRSYSLVTNLVAVRMGKRGESFAVED